MPELISLSKDSPDHYFEQVEALFVKMYNHMATLGLHYSLAPKGEKLWISSMKPTLGRLNELIIAIEGDLVLAFAVTTLRFLPAYLGSKKVGYLTHIYLEPELRKSGLGTALMEKVERWCRNQNVDSIELERISTNLPAKNFFLKLGYMEEQVKLRKISNAKIQSA